MSYSLSLEDDGTPVSLEVSLESLFWINYHVLGFSLFFILGQAPGRGCVRLLARRFPRQGEGTGLMGKGSVC